MTVISVIARCCPRQTRGPAPKGRNGTVWRHFGAAVVISGSQSRPSVSWAALAQNEGFADQAHMTREAKRVTGFAPGEFARRFIEDESFRLYRLWV